MDECIRPPNRQDDVVCVGDSKLYVPVVVDCKCFGDLVSAHRMSFSDLSYQEHQRESRDAGRRCRRVNPDIAVCPDRCLTLTTQRP